MKQVILLGGKAGSGKDTVASFLCKNYGYTRIAYADALKDYVSNTYNIKRELFDTQDGKKSIIKIGGENITLRQLLIQVGTEKKIDDENYWVDKVINDIYLLQNNKIVISDFRYPQEYTTLLKHFTIKTLKITRESIEDYNDSSETSLYNFKFDYIIDNNSTLKELSESVDTFFS